MSITFTNTDPFTYVTSSLQKQILSNLNVGNFKDLSALKMFNSLRRVCKEWKIIVDEINRERKELNLNWRYRYDTFDFKNYFNSNEIQVLGNIFPNLEQVSLSLLKVEIVVFEAFFKKISNLNKLNLENYAEHRPLDDLLCTVSNSCKKLASLSLTGNFSFTQKGIESLGSCQITEFKISKVTNFDDELLKRCALHLKFLKSVKLKGTRATVEGINNFLSQYTTLESVTLNAYGKNKQSLWLELLKTNSQIQKISTGGTLPGYANNMIEKKALQSISQNCKNLRSISILSCTLEEQEFSIILKNNPKLEKIGLIFCNGISSSILALMATTCKSLNKLYLSGKVNDEELLKIIRSNCQIRKIKLRNCEEITDIFVKAVVHEPQKIQIIDIIDCKKIQDESLSTLLSPFLSIQMKNYSDYDVSYVRLLF